MACPDSAPLTQTIMATNMHARRHVFQQGDQVLTTAEVARRYAVCTTTARRWCERGLLSGAELVGTGQRATWVVPEGALEGFVPPKPGRPRAKWHEGEASGTTK